MHEGDRIVTPPRKACVCPQANISYTEKLNVHIKIAKNSSLLDMAVRAESADTENFMQFEALNLDNYNLKIIVNKIILNAGF